LLRRSLLSAKTVEAEPAHELVAIMHPRQPGRDRGGPMLRM